MTINVNWDNAEQTIIHLEFSGIFASSDFDLISYCQAFEHMNRIIDETDYPVDLIVDITHVEGFAPGMMSKLQGLIQYTRASRVMVVGLPEHTSAIGQILSHVFSELMIYTTHAKTLNDARQMLQENIAQGIA